MHTQICTIRSAWDRADVQQVCTAMAVCFWCDKEVEPGQFCVVCERFVCIECGSVREPTPHRCESCRAAGSTVLILRRLGVLPFRHERKPDLALHGLAVSGAWASKIAQDRRCLPTEATEPSSRFAL